MSLIDGQDKWSEMMVSVGVCDGGGVANIATIPRRDHTGTDIDR